jgi:hypothetical protein
MSLGSTRKEEAVKTCRGIRSVVLVLALIPALAVLGSNPSEAKKKPKPPPPAEWLWNVELPECSDGSSDRNLCAKEQPIYADIGAEDGVWVNAAREGARGGEVSRFGFAVFKCEPDEDCYGESPDPVSLRGISLDSDWAPPDEVLPTCVFPVHPDSECTATVLTSPPGCLECFVNGEHPYWGVGQAQHEDDYRYFSFEVTVPGDFQDIGIGVVSSGDLTMEIINTWDTLINGDEDDHMVYSHVDLPGVGNNDITVTRVDEDTWQVVVNVFNVIPHMRFVESYVGCFKPPNKKSNCPWEYKHPIWAWTSGPLTFEATWTRTPAP